MKKYYYRLITIAGSDSSGGAGIQADLKTFSALGCYGMSVITAVTAQNTVGVKSIHPIPIDIIKDQADAILSDIGSDAVKVGMLFSSSVVDIVKKIIIEYDLKNIVFDPVMVSVNGDMLIEKETIQKIVKEMFPIVDLITPNVFEAQIILNINITQIEEMIDAAKKLIELGCKAVLIKGGRMCKEECYDVFYSNDSKDAIIFNRKSINTKNLHGTGCTLSSAIAAYLAIGHKIPQAISLAIDYTYKAINSGSNAILGKGRGPVNHFFNPMPTKFIYKE